MGEQVCPKIISSEPISSARLNLQETSPPNFSTSSSSAETFRSSSVETFRSSSAVAGVWEAEAREDNEEREVDRRMRSNSCSKPLFSNLNNNLKLARLTLSGYQHLLLHPTHPALQIWGTSQPK